ncbi:MAG: response regulator, partial [Opitutaceae bacterium]|nr:response regulator [Opitutaceae bacterium]
MNTPAQTRLLIIEDEESLRLILADLLELNGYQVLAAPDGTTGLALAAQHRPDVILTDLGLPDIDGIEIVRRLHADDTLRATPVIIVSAKADRAAIRQGMELGADDYITKPFTEEEVLRSIRARLEKKDLLDELDAFAHTVAHDLRNPLASLLGRLDLVKFTLDGTAKTDIRQQVEEAYRSARRLNSIIDDLLTLSGVRRVHVEPVRLDMREIVAEARERLDDLLTKTCATIDAPEAWPAVLGHRPWIVHVWCNYLSNAAKYAGPSARISLSAVPSPTHPGRVRFRCRDHGPG